MLKSRVFHKKYPKNREKTGKQETTPKNRKIRKNRASGDTVKPDGTD